MTSDWMPELAELPPGEFMMGETPDDKFATDTERPAHRVTIGYRFALGRCPITVSEYRRFAPGHAPGEEPNLPVVNVSWEEASDFCAKLAAATGRPFRLSTEAEWEYACRAGSRTPFAAGGQISTHHANFLYSEAGEPVGLGTRTPVGSYPSNAFGLHDLHGNVCEWVQDLWHPNYHGAPAGGRARRTGSDPGARVIRGGAWDYLPRLLRSSWRDSLPQTARRDNVGFRVALTLDPQL